MRIGIIGPLRSQFLHIQNHSAHILGNKHSLYWVDKDKPTEVIKAMRSWSHFDRVVICSAWISHLALKNCNAHCKNDKNNFVFVNTRGQTGVVEAIKKLLT